MSKKFKDQLAFYGNKAIPRGYCHNCKVWSLVVEGRKLCCGNESQIKPEVIKRFCSPAQKRKLPSSKERKRLLEEFDYSCAYCGKKFGQFLNINGNVKKLRLNWDHNIPWAYSQNNHSSNFLPCCNFCNGWKSSKIFRTIDDIRIYVSAKWEEYGLD